MKKLILILALCLISMPAFCAENACTTSPASPQVKQSEEGLELLDRLKNNRNSIYKVLNLSQDQELKIKELDAKLYTEIEPSLAEMTKLVNRLNAVIKTENFTINDIKTIRKSYDTAARHASAIKKSYDKEFVKLLTPEQKTRYKIERARQKAALAKEIEILRQNSSAQK